MIIGVPKEIKISENRVGLTEAGVRQYVSEGHTVIVEKDAGVGSGISNEQYEKAGAKIIDTKKEVYAKADMIQKVKEPLPDEYELMKENQILYTYLHLAAEAKLTKVLCERKVKAIAYETIQLDNGSLPLLTPMSEVAGRMATQIGAFYLQKDHGGKGILMGGVTGVKPAKVTIIGGGVVGTNAAKMAVGLGASVTILDVNTARLEYLDDIFQGRCMTLFSNAKNIEDSVKESDLVVGGVLITGHKAPTLVSKEMISSMAKGSVVVDVAVDQGGCIETCRPTSHTSPTYEVDGVIHYCVPNMPGVVPRTSTYALTNVTLRYGSMIAAMGVEDAVAKSPALLKGLNVYGGHVVYEPVARDLHMEYKPYKI
ncbi:alanine dehydrogenase [Bdellovibrio bacteriovorus]|uniref:Alanine dehydrogenase n=1 Tax=Bdellovibrio bacteriovorus (strain ATCC 15356 / DSM 50701 / NCIMB 9529 / HD100) TaxID=264462 RepID=Q6MKC3_BDEBA|nr:alanine dehydrogenase [Bdellovibrio bacteriovorus]AHZ84990.1 alanine dehydrogenase [Bdellovibrio bacteriovorus]BEV68877.1 Alanine dehydrogenase [Bdellovibrio bacteriovorus]CAE80284.1 alaDH [Bdellovibrio bacteriovorus HD100]